MCIWRRFTLYFPYSLRQPENTDQKNVFGFSNEIIARIFSDLPFWCEKTEYLSNWFYKRQVLILAIQINHFFVKYTGISSGS